MSAIRPADALEAWRSDPRLPDVIRACHPPRASMDVTVAASADDDLIGMVTCCAVAGGLPVRLMAVGTAQDMVRALGVMARVARSLGRTVRPDLWTHSLLCRLVEVEQ